MDIGQLMRIIVTIFCFAVGFSLLLLPIKKERVINAIKRKTMSKDVIKKYQLLIHIAFPLGIIGILVCISIIWYIILTSESLYNISSIDRLLFPVSLLCGAVGVYVFSSRFFSLLSKIYEVKKP